MSGMSNICDRLEIGGGQRLLKEELESEKIKKCCTETKSKVS